MQSLKFCIEMTSSSLGLLCMDIINFQQTQDAQTRNWWFFMWWFKAMILLLLILGKVIGFEMVWLMFQYISGMESTTQLSIVPQCPKSIPSIHSMSPVHSNPCHISPWPRDEICKEYMKAFQECHVEAELIYVAGLNNQSDQPDDVYQFTSNGKIR